MTLSDDYIHRFSGISRLYGVKGLEKLASSHVASVGLGGVGSWIVEAIARAGVGAITLMDFDDICVSNFNRQIHSLDNTVGRFKVDVMAERVKSINKECQVHIINDRFTAENSQSLLNQNYDYIIDAFDNGPGKAFLANHCRRAKKKLIILGSVGGKTDPSLIRIDDLSRSKEDSLLSFMRKKLRQDYGFSREKDKKFGIPCVFSTEKYVYFEDGCVIKDRKPKDSLKQLDCQTGMGAVTHLTGAFGFFAVSRVISELTSDTEGLLQE
jgi:tRNA threonylcarbamoyladenosine dehydratase